MTRVKKARSRSWIWKKRPRRMIILSSTLLLLLIGWIIVSTYDVRLMIERQGLAHEETEDEEGNEYIINDASEDVSQSDQYLMNSASEDLIESELVLPIERSFGGSSRSVEDVITLSHDEALCYLALVNRNFRLSSEFSPSDLSVVNALNVYGNINQWITMRATAARALERMLTAANDESGHTLLIISGYRSYETQTMVHHHAIINQGETEALRFSARPGHSEHQLGLAIDLSTFGLGGQLSSQFSSTPEGMWIRNNAHRFGFIIRYPNGREPDTGFAYEPWHLRYIGVDAAMQMFGSDIILEEFLEIN